MLAIDDEAASSDCSPLCLLRLLDRVTTAAPLTIKNVATLVLFLYNWQLTFGDEVRVSIHCKTVAAETTVQVNVVWRANGKLGKIFVAILIKALVHTCDTNLSDVVSRDVLNQSQAAGDIRMFLVSVNVVLIINLMLYRFEQAKEKDVFGGFLDVIPCMLGTRVLTNMLSLVKRGLLAEERLR
ncbi:hypothetical protein C8Q80DRAFT_1269681 [Daedaleopsis nitida]|nr:hypothetical protein C8Q80DRAFT_1269681 [Daedaleopsis nitida]